MSVRRGTVDDLAELVALERSAPEAPYWTEAQYRDALEGMPQGAVSRCLFVWEGELGLLGFAAAMVLHAGELCDGELENVVVASTARRSGIASALCMAAIAWCGGQGATGMALEVRASSSGAIALYRALGFAVVGRRREYYRTPCEDARIMRLQALTPRLLGKSSESPLT